MIGAEAASASPRGATPERLDLDSLPGPKRSPVLGQYGNILSFVVDPIGYMDKLAYGNYGNVVIFARGMNRGLLEGPASCPGAVFLSGPGLAHQVLTKHAAYPRTVVASLPQSCGDAARLTEGVTWLQGPPHRTHRRVITPLYHQRRIRHYRDKIVEVTGRTLERFVPGQSVALVEVSGDSLIAVQNTVVLGVSGMSGELSRLAQDMVSFTILLNNPWSNIGPNLPLSPRRRMLESGAHLVKQIKKLIALKRQAAEPGDDVLSMMAHSHYENGDVLSEDELVAEMFQLFIGGWISTRSSFASTLFLLAQHPEASEKLYDELHSMLGGEAPTLEQLEELPYLDAVIKESHRLMPPIPYLSRAPSEPVHLGGYQLPANTELLLSIYHTHRDPETYPEPQRFLPERWETLQPATNAYLPFGIGPRVCPGMALAKLQLKLMVAMIAQRVRLEVPVGSKINYGGMGVIVPKPDLTMQVHAQDRRFSASRAPVTGNINTMVDLSACG